MNGTTATTQQEDPSARPRRLSDVFHCSFRSRRMYLATCLDDYMNANALRVKSMVCHDCIQGADNRETFAADADTEGVLDEEIWGRLIADLGEGDLGKPSKK
ncbi:MAG TPA: hypothetical protein DCQ06_13860 [Myxococcales bacterium]|nr:hypothetical protein [Myxococcales bacterium]HAN32676.1 hypothetical protein [Myxococcales bacterium]